MDLRHLFDPLVPVERLKVWVLVPCNDTKDENLQYYYDFQQSYNEYLKCFKLLDINWEWKLIGLNNYKEVINEINDYKNNNNDIPLVLNLCDGDEINGSPGVSIIKYLDKLDIIYTGADEYFYDITTSKIPMKEAFDLKNITTPSWQIIDSNIIDSKIWDNLESPIILKPAISGGSLGVGIKNVVYNHQELENQIKNMTAGYHGAKLDSSGIIAEEFIRGREFTIFIVGSYNLPDHCKIYTPIERVFHKSLPKDEQFLSFDRLWEIYEHEDRMPNDESFYELVKADDSLIEELKELSLQAYKSVKGVGYTRIDIRFNEANKKLYVLEVNAQCGISEDENYTCTGAILRLSNISFEELMIDIINDAFLRRKK